MDPPVPRPATPADIPELVRVINAAYRVEDFFVTGDRTSTAEVGERLSRPGAGFLVVDAPGAAGLAGAVFVECRGALGYFGMLSVDPARQGAGLGRRLVAAAEERCRKEGCRSVEIEVVNLREELPAFYRKLGFEPAGEAPFHTAAKLLRPAHMLLMRKNVDPEQGRG